MDIPLESLTPIVDSLEVIELKTIISEINVVLQAENINITSALMSRRESSPRLRRINPFRLSLERRGGMVLSSWIENINIIRRGLERRNILTPEFGEALSKLIARSLGLHKVKTASEAHTKIDRYIENEREREAAFADWINACHIPLRDAGMTAEQLKRVARNLQYVDCTNFELEDLERFISSCTRAHHLIINSPNIKKLDTLPLSLRAILIIDCALNELDVSKNSLLQSIDISNCPIEVVDREK